MRRRAARRLIACAHALALALALTLARALSLSCMSSFCCCLIHSMRAALWPPDKLSLPRRDLIHHHTGCAGCIALGRPLGAPMESNDGTCPRLLGDATPQQLGALPALHGPHARAPPDAPRSTRPISAFRDRVRRAAWRCSCPRRRALAGDRSSRAADADLVRWRRHAQKRIEREARAVHACRSGTPSGDISG